MHRARKLWFPLAITGVALTTACQDSVPTVTDTAEQAARPAFAVSSAGSLTVTVGQTIQLTSPNYRPRSGDFISLTPAMLKVTEAGLATGIAPGTAKAIFKNRYVCDTVIVSVVAPSTTPKVASVTVALPMSSVSLGQLQTATATARDSSGAAITAGTSTTWSSSNTAVATVSSIGAVSAVGAGSATITATISGATGSAQLSVQSPPPSGPTGTTVTGAAALPQAQVNVGWVAPTGKTITVAAGGNLQAALNNAQPGDEIVLAAGATFTGNFVLPAKPTGAANPWILVRTSGRVPALGQRATPLNTAGQWARVVTPSVLPAIKTAPGAHHWRLVGLEVTGIPVKTTTTVLVDIGDGSSAQNTLAKVPSYITLDRSWVHGSSTLQVRRCVGLHGAYAAVINSTVDQCVSRSTDTQALGGWNGPGPLRIENNYLEGSSENISFGGTSVAISGMNPADIEIRGNHIAKPASWKGGPWLIKNLIEFKSGMRVLIENNLIEGNWAAGQVGFAVLLKSVTQGGQCPWCSVQDVTVRYNHVRRSGAGFNVAANPDGDARYPAQRITIVHNLLDEINTGIYTGEGRLFQLLNAQLNDITIAHNTGIGTDIAVALTDTPMQRLVMRDNVLVSTKGYGIYSGNGKGQGTMALNYHAPGWTFAGNVLAGSSSFVKSHPAGNYYPATLTGVGFTSPTSLNYTLGSSAYRGMATDGTDPGADIPTVLARTANVVVP